MNAYALPTLYLRSAITVWQQSAEMQCRMVEGMWAFAGAWQDRTRDVARCAADAAEAVAEETADRAAEALEGLAAGASDAGESAAAESVEASEVTAEVVEELASTAEALAATAEETAIQTFDAAAEVSEEFTSTAEEATGATVEETVGAASEQSERNVAAMTEVTERTFEIAHDVNDAAVGDVAEHLVAVGDAVQGERAVEPAEPAAEIELNAAEKVAADIAAEAGRKSDQGGELSAPAVVGSRSRGRKKRG